MQNALERSERDQVNLALLRQGRNLAVIRPHASGRHEGEAQENEPGPGPCRFKPPPSRKMNRFAETGATESGELPGHFRGFPGASSSLDPSTIRPQGTAAQAAAAAAAEARASGLSHGEDGRSSFIPSSSLGVGGESSTLNHPTRLVSTFRPGSR